MKTLKQPLYDQQPASTPLLTTKLLIPPRRGGLVPRPHLDARLREGFSRPLLLLSAPAGFGKTTLLTEWLHQEPDTVETVGALRPSQVAWLSLDPADSDPVRFWSYVVAALELPQPQLVYDLPGMLRAVQPAPIEGMLTLLINRIATYSEHMALVLDDYHAIENQAVHEQLSFLLMHLPPQFHIVILGRADPPLPLARMRARRQLTELRAHDLRFTPDEVAEFLNQTAGLGLAPADIGKLEARTEGWIAGLQLAALSLQGQAQISDAIASFTGTDRYIFDYLLEEVIQRQSPDIQQFLLQTAILERMNGPLCDAVLGLESKGMQQPASSTFLDTLERTNLFIVPLDNQRQWYRYHHLFAHLLRARLIHIYPGKLTLLHRRAALWHEQQGLIEAAIPHRIAAEDHQHAALLVEQITPVLLRRGEVTTLTRLLEQLPPALIRTRPGLCLSLAWARLAITQFERAEAPLQDAETILGVSADTVLDQATLDQPLIPGSPATLGHVLGNIDAVRATVAINFGHAERAIILSRRALERIPQSKSQPAPAMMLEDPTIRGVTLLNLADAYSSNGDLIAAEQAYADSLAFSYAADSPFFIVNVLGSMGHLQAMAGRLNQAASIYRQALEYSAQASNTPSLLPIGKVQVFYGSLLYERNELDRAAEQLAAGIERCTQWGHLQHQIDGYLPLARVRYTQGDLQAAHALIQQARTLVTGAIESIGRKQRVPERLYWLAEHVAATQVRLWLAEGNLAAAARWAEEPGPGQEDISLRTHTAYHLAHARILITQEAYIPALTLLERLIETIQSARQGRLIEILVIQALVFQAQGMIPEAYATLERALTLGEAGGYIRTFLDEGPPLVALLRTARAHGIRPGYVDLLLGSLEQTSQTRSAQSTALPITPYISEPLSERELQVLRLIAAYRSNQEIAEALVVSINTVKTHIKRIYEKLQVGNRLEAVERARSQGML